MVFNSSSAHCGYAFPCLAGFQLSPQASHVTWQNFQVAFSAAKARLGNASTLTCYHSAASCVLRDAGKDTVWYLTLLVLFCTPAQGNISPLSIHCFPHLLICGFFSFSFIFSRCLQFPNMFPNLFRCQLWS